MQDKPTYKHTVIEILKYFADKLLLLRQMGVNDLIIDPGFGFGKTDEHNLNLLKSLARFKTLKVPILVGLSRKSMIGRLLGREVNERLPGSLLLALAAAKNGANIVRVHDVQATADMFKLSRIIGEI